MYQFAQDIFYFIALCHKPVSKEDIISYNQLDTMGVSSYSLKPALESLKLMGLIEEIPSANPLYFLSEKGEKYLEKALNLTDKQQTIINIFKTEKVFYPESIFIDKIYDFAKPDKELFSSNFYQSVRVVVGKLEAKGFIRSNYSDSFSLSLVGQKFLL